jgi:hypothetical protein
MESKTECLNGLNNTAQNWVEKAKHFPIETDGKSEIELKKEIFDFRKKQGYGSRLVEHITGMRPDNPLMADRLVIDQKIIRAKYQLPNRGYRFYNSGDYEIYLRNLATTNGVRVKEASECGNFFEKTPMAGGVYFSENKAIGVDMDKSSDKKYITALGTLEHECIHSLQDKYFKGMPIEVQEYEAYVAAYNTEYLKQNPDAIELVMSFGIGGSVKNWYREESENRGEEVKPEWDNEEYFLRNVDGFNDEDIKIYTGQNNEAVK